MSDDYGSEAQRLKFARDWEAAIKRGLEEATSSEYTITTVKLWPWEAEELRDRSAARSRLVSDAVPTEATVSNALEEDNDLAISNQCGDDLQDLDYRPSEDEEEARPQAFDAMKLTAASKRKDRPFAPPERSAKKSKSVEKPTIVHPAARRTNTRVPVTYTRSQLQNLLYLRTLVVEVQQEATKISFEMPNLLGQLRTRLNEIALYDNVSAALVQNSRLLDEGGLSDIFNKKGFNFPEDLCADAVAQYHKWVIGDFDSDLFRGIENKQHMQPNGRIVRTSKSLEAGYRFKVSASYVGKGDLTNGQWWPLQICLLRDGAHGVMEGGISGESGGVAHSVIVSNSGYANIDNGDQVEYCGTSSRTSQPTAATKMLLESVRRQSPVRLIRSSAANTSTYLPKKGLRYDGLYDVTQHVLLDADTAMYRFTLVRQQGQGAIRYIGEDARPNAQELESYRRADQQ